MFGQNPPLGLKTTAIPSEKWCELNTEKDFVEFLGKIQVNGNPIQQGEYIHDDDNDEGSLEQLMEGEMVEIITSNKTVIERENDAIFNLNQPPTTETNKPVTETLETEIIKRVTRIREKRKNTDE